MTNNPFKVMQQYNKLVEVANEFIAQSDLFINHAKLELWGMEIKINRKVLSFSLSNSAEMRSAFLNLKQDNLIDDDHIRIVESVQIYDKFSWCNVFVWLKRYYRLYETLSSELSQCKKDARELLSQVKQMSQQLTNSTRKPQIDAMLSDLDAIRADLLAVAEYQLKMFEGHKNVEMVIDIVGTFNKNNFMSLLTLKKDSQTVQRIANLPDQLTYDDYIYSIFRRGIEDNSCYYLYDFMLDHIMNFKEANPQLRQQMNTALGIDMLPTFTVTTDEYGDVASITQNKPTLRVIK